MIGRLAWRSLTAHPIRSAVLAAGFGFGVAVMAILLGVAEIVLDQAEAPALVGGGDVLIRTTAEVPGRLLLAGTLQADDVRPRVAVASPNEAADLFLMKNGSAIPVRARGGIPSLQRALGDNELAGVPDWSDTDADRAWIQDSPDKLLRQIDRFHPVPENTEWSSSWAEWLYFNGRAENARFYLTFLVGPRAGPGRRSAGVRLQLERDGRMETYGATATLSDDEVSRAPELTIGQSSVRLDGMRYRVHLDLVNAQGKRITGDVTLTASAGKLVPPFEIGGARGWKTGYVVPVMSGPLEGTLSTSSGAVTLDGGTGYHDHNWGFWQGVSWQWGQVQHGDLSFLYGRVFPPRDAADPDRMPGFVGALGPDGPLGYATDVNITEKNDADGRPASVQIRARGPSLDLTMTFDVDSVESTRMRMVQGPLSNNVDFLQLRGRYTFKGRAGGREISGTAAGAAETFRGNR